MNETEKSLAKLKKSREYRLDSDNQSYIGDLEKKLEALKTDAAFQRLDQVKRMQEVIKSIILDCKRKLIDEDDAKERARLKADRDAYSRILRFFSRDVEKEMKDIDMKVQELM